MKAEKHRRRSELEDTSPRGEPSDTYMPAITGGLVVTGQLRSLAPGEPTV
jgi:hypothetical protein